MSKYGKNTNEVKKFEGANFFEFENQRDNDSLEIILSKTILGFSEFVAEEKPDLVVIHGDRIEALAASLVCAMKYIRTAHIEGGEMSGSIDESSDIAILNYALLFVSSRLKKSPITGEQKGSIFTIGSPELDIHMKNRFIYNWCKKRYSINFDEYGIVIFHPVTSEIDTIGDQAGALFKALKETKKFIVIAPNNDHQGKDFSILNLLDKNYFKIFPPCV